MLTPDEIYQTYLRGPAAIIRLFEQTFGTIRSYLSTMSKQGRGALLALERACAGRPFSPTS
jgi:hypothetical protein